MTLGFSKEQQVGKRELKEPQTGRKHADLSLTSNKGKQVKIKAKNADLRKPIKQVSVKQAKRNKKLAEIPPPSDGRCEECGGLPDWRGLAKDHDVLRSGGGKDNIENIIWKCGVCHSRKHGIIEK